MARTKSGLPILPTFLALCLAYSLAPAQTPAPNSQRKAQAQAGADERAEPLPPGVVARLGKPRTMSRNDAPFFMHEINKVKHSRDGKMLAAANKDGIIGLWNLDTNQIGPIMKVRTNAFCDIAFTSNGTQLVSCSDESVVQIWDAKDGKELRRFPLHDASNEKPWHVHKMHLTPDDRSVVVLGYGSELGMRRGMLSSYDLATGARKTMVEVGGSDGYYSALSPDGLFWASQGQIVETLTGKNRLKLEGDPQNLGFYAYSSDGRLVAGMTTQGPHVWRTETGSTLRAVNMREAGQYAFTPDSRFVITVEIGGIRLWELQTGGVALAHAAHDRSRGSFGPSFASCISLAPDGRSLATGHKDGTILIWGMAVWSVAVTADQLPRLWSDLASSDAAKAYEAIWALTNAPAQTMPYLRKRMRPVVAASEAEMKPLLDDLDSRDFKRRDQSTRKLREMGDRAVAALVEVLKSNPTLEMRRRVEGLLKELDSPHSGEVLGALRAVTVLERIATRDTIELLKELAAGDAEVRLTREAKLSLNRLGKPVGK